MSRIVEPTRHRVRFECIWWHKCDVWISEAISGVGSSRMDRPTRQWCTWQSTLSR